MPPTIPAHPLAHRLGWTLLAGMLAALPACGAGVITAVAASDSGNSPAASPPAISLGEGTLPLVPPVSGFTGRQLVISNLELASLQEIQVQIVAEGVVDVQENAAILSSSGSGTVIGFIQDTGAIQLAVGDATARDISAQIEVVSPDGLVAPPVGITLLRQPRATLEGQTTGTRFVSVDGSSTVTVRLTDFRTAPGEDLEFLIATLDPAAGPPAPGFPRAVELSELSDLTLEAGAGDQQWLLTGRVPRSAFPGPALLFVQNLRSGRSTPVLGVSYEPVVQQVFPPRGSTAGGERVALAGAGLVPLDFNVGPAELDFEEVQIEVRKGGRTAVVDGSLVRAAESAGDRLVFDMPPSPDGRSGPADIVVAARALGVNDARITARVTGAGFYTFGDNDPVFAPRGANLASQPIAIAPISLDDPGVADQLPDLLLLGENGGRPQVQLLLAEENGVYTRAGKGITGGNPLDNGLQNPVDLLTGDFNADGVADGLAIQAGIGSQARHLLFAGGTVPGPYLRTGQVLFSSAPGSVRALGGDLDGDGATDVVLLRDDGAATPSVTVHCSAAGWSATADLAVPVPSDAVMALADVDGDLLLDLLLGFGGSNPGILVLPGDGAGGFAVPVAVDLTGNLDGRATSPQDRCLTVWSQGANDGIALVLSGDPATPACPPAVALCPKDPADSRNWLLPAMGEVTQAVSDGLWSNALAGDLDDDGVVEVVAVSSLVGGPLRVLGRLGQAYQEQVSAIDALPQTLQDVTSLAIVDGAIRSDGSRVPAVLLVHSERVDGAIETRLSTALVRGGDPVLSSPQVVRTVGGAAVRQVEAITAGPFLGGPDDPWDIVVAGDDEVQIYRNDGLGEMAPDVGRAVPGLIPASLSRIEAPSFSGGIPSVAWLREDPATAAVTLEIWLPATDSLVVAGSAGAEDLRALLPTPLQSLGLGPACRIKGVDLDRDGAGDLVVLLSFDGLADPGEGEAFLLAWRGLPGGSLPVFSTPATGLAVHGRSVDVVAGEFTVDPAASDRLEILVAVLRGTASQPGNGSHLRAYRLVDQGVDLVPVRSFGEATAQVLPAGSGPERLRAVDLDGDGADDVIVAAGGDRTLRVFLNSGLPATAPGREGEVELSGFQEAATSPRVLAPGRPVSVGLLDANGNGAVDVLVNTLDAASSPWEPALGLLAGSGTGEFGLVEFLPRTRTGSHAALVGGGTLPRGAAMVTVVGEFNGDGRDDLAMGFADVSGQSNLLLLFGSTR